MTVLFLGALLAAAAGLTTQYVFQEPAHITLSRVLMPEFRWQRQKYPSLRWAFDLVEPLIHHNDPQVTFRTATEAGAGESDWLKQLKAVGPRHAEATPASPANGPVVVVDTVEEFRRTLQSPQPGTTIEVRAGVYEFFGTAIALTRPGRPGARIVLRAQHPGRVVLRFALLEGFHVLAPYWTIEGFVIEGICRNDSRCEHAFHVVGEGKNAIIQDNWVRNFNASVKVNGKGGAFPDSGLILRNAFVNDRPRRTDKPVTLLDIVSASGWRVQQNIIADFAKAGGNHTSYAAFFKGAGENNVFERNLVRCEWRHRGGARIGFSFGDGGTARRHCRDLSCAVQHRGGIVRNNIIMDCPNEAGIYLNKSAATEIYNNALVNTRGIDVRFPESDARIVNNIIDGRILAKDGGRYIAKNNVQSRIQAAFLGRVSEQVYISAKEGNFRLREAEIIIGQGQAVQGSALDFCGRPLGEGPVDIGPFQQKGDAACIADQR